MKSSRVRALAVVTLAGIVSFTISIGARHWLQPELSPLDEAMSYYVHGRGGWLLTVGLLSLGLGSLALTVAFEIIGGALLSRSGRWCLGVWSFGASLGAIFAADPPEHWDKTPSISGSIHGSAAMVALVSFPIAAIFLPRSLRSNARWTRLSAFPSIRPKGKRPSLRLIPTLHRLSSWKQAAASFGNSQP